MFQRSAFQRGSALTYVLLGMILLAMMTSAYVRNELHAYDQDQNTDGIGAWVYNEMAKGAWKMTHDQNWLFNTEQIAINAWQNNVSYNACAANSACANKYGNLITTEQSTVNGTTTITPMPTPDKLNLNFANVSAMQLSEVHWTNGAPPFVGFAWPFWVNASQSTTTAPYSMLQFALASPQHGTIPVNDWNLLAMRWCQNGWTNPQDNCISHIGYVFPAANANGPMVAASPTGAVMAWNSMGGQGFFPLSYYLQSANGSMPNEPASWTAGAPQKNPWVGISGPTNTSIPVGQMVPGAVWVRKPLDGLILAQTVTTGASGACPDGSTTTSYTITTTKTKAGQPNGVTSSSTTTSSPCPVYPPGATQTATPPNTANCVTSTYGSTICIQGTGVTVNGALVGGNAQAVTVNSSAQPVVYTTGQYTYNGQTCWTTIVDGSVLSPPMPSTASINCTGGGTSSSQQINSTGSTNSCLGPNCTGPVATVFGGFNIGNTQVRSPNLTSYSNGSTTIGRAGT